MRSWWEESRSQGVITVSGVMGEITVGGVKGVITVNGVKGVITVGGAEIDAKLIAKPLWDVLFGIEFIH